MNRASRKLSQLYIDFQPELIGYICTQFAFQRVQAEDVVQHAFAKYAENGAHRDLESPRAYLYKIVHNLALDCLRRHRHQQAGLASLPVTYPSQHAQAPDPARLLAAQQEIETTRQALTQMPAQRRRYIELSRFENLSNVEIARREGLSEAAVRKHIARAVLDLKRALDLAHAETH